MSFVNCPICEHCTYIGEGDYYCDMIQEIVVEDHVDCTDYYGGCHGKYFMEEE